MESFQKDWLNKNANKYYIKELIIEYNKTFDTNINYDQMRYILRKNNIKPLVDKKYNKRYSVEEINWIKDNYSNYNNLHKMSDDFNERFNHELPYRHFINLCNRHNIASYTLHKYSKEEDEWIKNNYQNYIQDGVFRTKRFINDFEKEFSFKIDCKNIGRLFERLSIEKPKSNVGLERCPIGFEKKNSYGILIKISDNVPTNENRWKNKQKFNYRKKAHILYEQYHNVKINDETHLVIHLDDNNENFDKDNLYLISRKAFYIYHNTRYINQSLETKLNALKLSEIQQLIKEIE